MPSITPRDRKSGGPATLCDIVMIVGPGRLRTGSLGTSGEHQDGRQRDGQTSSRKPERKESLPHVSRVSTRFTGLLWLATGTNGDVTGARSRKSTNNGSAGDKLIILVMQIQMTMPFPEWKDENIVHM
ncbi:unnamed protein product [Haemonchus placei]|uniref:Uncharacterized protein n=1 Tax=Haemonchus placei TaxID=6290 RepID=A0A0N4WN04_HAEPC|nr:unnamed protein product [Haemonchus placei]